MRSLPAALQLVLTAIPVALFALLVFRFASSQSGIRAAKDRIQGHLLELWLYRDSPRVQLRAQGQVIVSSLEYLGYSVVPLAVMIVPLALVLAQVEAHFGARGLAAGESAIVTATFAGRPADVPLAATGGIAVETPPLRIDERRQALWRIRASAERGELAISGARVPIAGASTRALAPVTYREDDWRLLLYPAATPLPAAGEVESVAVDYPRVGFTLLGLSRSSWILMVASMLIAYGVRRPLRVEF